ncbi:MAG: 50S ribosomal protein L21 [Candidatus Woykebacteria bacterium RIFCSPHIGHO2_12_FULL_45_10]|uniref:Large ribosomal subunit protein bL21 n=1 Tax=Candidatus Woykebacteria bacterium RIFCSPHIGHO2_12_FULL_45_10 TaxID=1802603 RepID=A0A1G1WQT4_9BACT|nr:MAG: 50S ribosomal protein L21 [Candidatus Woykebacteria bacterium RIFCSPHIGHO2_12_FULL_45_10]
MEYAVIKVSGKQYKVSPGDQIKVEAKVGEKDKKIEFDSVLLSVEDSLVKIGQPTLEAKVIGTVIEHGKAKKVNIATYKAKGGQQRHAGHRQDQTTVRIETIKGK